MKKIFLKVRNGRILLLFIILSAASVIYSCRKELKLTEQQAKNELAANNFPVAVAQNWFDAKKTVLSNKVKVNSDAAFLSRIADFTPEWDKARTAVDTNFFVVEAPAKYASAIGFSTDSSKNNINGLTRLLILKNKKTERLHAVLMQIHGDKGVDINNVHYMDIPKDFSGNIFFTTLQGLFYNGYIYKKGRVELVSAGQSTTKRPDLQVLQEYVPGYCIETTTDWYDVTCWVEHNGDIERCQYEYMYTEIETYCVPGYYIPSGGGGTVNLPECPPGGGNNPPVTVESVNGRKIVNLVAPGDGGDDSPCYTPPQPDPFYDILNEIKNPCLKAMVANMIEKNVKGKVNGLIQSVFNGSGSIDLTFTDQIPMVNSTDDAEEFGSRDDPNDPTKLTSVSINLDASKLAPSSREYIAATIMHEALHAYLDSKSIEIGDAQHAEMAGKYVDTMAGDLMAMFPDMKKETAYALAWGGLETTEAYKKASLWVGKENTPEYKQAKPTFMPAYQVGLNALMRAHKADGKTFGHGC